MRQANTYGYAEYRGKLGKLNYRFGMGVTRSWFKQEGQEDYETWSLNPQFNLNYTFNKHWSTSLTGGLNTGHPSLSQLSAVDQLTDSLQISRGNPLLKPYDSWNCNFRLNYNKGKVNIGFFGKYNHRENPIMPYIYRENGKFIHSYANHDRFQNLNVGMNVRVGMLWDILQLSGSISNDTRWSRGINYNHHHNSLGWSLEAAMLYKKFVFSARYQKNTDYLFGENFTTGEVMHYIALQYRIKKLNVGLMMLNPFENDYCRNENNLNQYAGNTFEYHIDDSARMIWATLSWNFSFGRDYKSGSKRMNNSDTDSGVM
jgi:outer membrane receptor protein involved in Fe transport